MMASGTHAVCPLSEEQWQGIAKLGEWVNVVHEALEGPLGSVAIDYVEHAANIVPSDTLSAVEETLTMLVEWSKDGTLRRIHTAVALISSMFSEENVNGLALAMIDKAQESHLPQTVDALIQGLSVTARKDTHGLGGIGGMMRLMTNKDVQAGLRMLSTIAVNLQRREEQPTRKESSRH